MFVFPYFWTRFWTRFSIGLFYGSRNGSHGQLAWPDRLAGSLSWIAWPNRLTSGIQSGGQTTDH